MKTPCTYLVLQICAVNSPTRILTAGFANNIIYLETAIFRLLYKRTMVLVMTCLRATSRRQPGSELPVCGSYFRVTPHANLSWKKSCQLSLTWQLNITDATIRQLRRAMSYRLPVPPTKAAGRFLSSVRSTFYWSRSRTIGSRGTSLSRVSPNSRLSSIGNSISKVITFSVELHTVSNQTQSASTT